jgi:nitric oxide reductase subunit B
LIILAKIILQWKENMRASKQNIKFLPARFMIASDVWIFLNLIVAILISIPAVNIYTHGTHVTVAHAMGSTIGINTMILLSSCLYIFTDLSKGKLKREAIQIKGFWLLNVCLFIFWISLLAAGIHKGILVIENKLLFQEIMNKISIYLKIFALAGAGIFVGLLSVTYPIILGFFKEILRKENKVIELVCDDPMSNINEPFKKTA